MKNNQRPRKMVKLLLLLILFAGLTEAAFVQKLAKYFYAKVFKEPLMPEK
jgi:hypothetical protein